MTARMRGIWWLFVGNAFVSAALLFMSEPLIGRLLLPLFGGAPAAWNACMVFFQAALLFGYAYAHWSVQRLGLKRQPWVHVVLVLLPLLLLPLALPAWAADTNMHSPLVRIIGILIVTVGAPFFVLATTGPLLQRWFAATRHPGAKEPYFLYAASNLGSFIALLGYPLVVEPMLHLSTQTKWWSYGYGLFAVLMIVCALALRRFHRPGALEIPAPQKRIKIPPASRMYWLLLAFLPSSLMLGVTTHLTTDVAAVPLLWVIPLAIYLLTFVVAFSRRQPLALAARLVPFAVAGLTGVVVLSVTKAPLSSATSLIFYLVSFALIAQIAHAKLAAHRPVATALTEFYLWVAVGGVAGGIFNSLVAPVIFNNVYEFPLMLLLGLPVIVGMSSLMERLGRRKIMWAAGAVGIFLADWLLIWAGPDWLVRNFAELLVALPVGALFFLYRFQPKAVSVALVPLLSLPLAVMIMSPSILTERTFYGVLKVEQKGTYHVLMHGLTQHGSQDTRPQYATRPSTYYHPQGPLGDAMAICRTHAPCTRVGVMGLGAGTLATYGRAGDDYTFYEIDPAVIAIAQNPRYFTYLHDSAARTHIVTGDARLEIAKAPDGSFDLLVMDVFSSDAIPMHLLTKEALALYERKLAPGGMIAVHISNRLLNLEPPLAAGAKSLGMQAIAKVDKSDFSIGKYGTHWVMLAPKSTDISRFTSTYSWHLPAAASRVWTDDYANILEAF